MILNRAPFIGRKYFGSFLNDLQLEGLAVEIGTDRGEFAASFLYSWHGNRLYCIDPWITGYSNRDPVSQRPDREDDYLATIKALEPYPYTAKVLKEYSNKAVHRFTDSSLSFVYLDGNHEPEVFKEDLDIWWHKVKSGGILAGHDIINDDWGKDIQSILIPWATEKLLDIYLVPEPDNSPWSYYLTKPIS